EHAEAVRLRQLADQVQALAEDEGAEVATAAGAAGALHLQLVDDADPGVGRHVLRDHAGGADEGMVADVDGTEDARAGADLDAVAQARVALASGVVGDAGGAQGDAAEQVAVVADLAGLADHRAEAVVEHEAPADARGRSEEHTSELQSRANL